MKQAIIFVIWTAYGYTFQRDIASSKLTSEKIDTHWVHISQQLYTHLIRLLVLISTLQNIVPFLIDHGVKHKLTTTGKAVGEMNQPQKPSSYMPSVVSQRASVSTQAFPDIACAWENQLFPLWLKLNELPISGQGIQDRSLFCTHDVSVPNHCVVTCEWLCLNPTKLDVTVKWKQRK